MTRIPLLAVLLTVGACARPTRLFATTTPLHPSAGALAAVPRFVIVPALDDRPRAERDGAAPEPSFLFASEGGAMAHHSGAGVLAGNHDLAWSPGPLGRGSMSNAVAADLGHAIESAGGRPVGFVAGGLDDAAAGAPDGSVVVALVVDHLTKISPANLDYSQTKSQEGDYEVTTTTTASESFGPFWTFTFRIELGEVRGGRIARRQVRYTSLADTATSGYADAITAAAYQVVEAVAADWSTPAATPG